MAYAAAVVVGGSHRKIVEPANCSFIEGCTDFDASGRKP
jgi:hypothetical protein